MPQLRLNGASVRAVTGIVHSVSDAELDWSQLVDSISQELSEAWM